MKKRYNKPFFGILRAIIVALAIGLAPSFAFAQSTGQEFYEQGNTLYNQKKYTEAVASYTKAIQLQPSSQAKAYLNCARAYVMLKDYANGVRFYGYYSEVEVGSATDRKVAGELKAARRKLKSDSPMPRPDAQTNVLSQIESTIAQGGPFYNRQGGLAFAYYDVLLRTGFAEPLLKTLQRKLVDGLLAEIQADIKPLPEQVLPALDRVGWEFVRNKLGRLSQFPDVLVDATRISRIENTAKAWEAYYRGQYAEASALFDLAINDNDPILAAYWGRMMTSFQTGPENTVIANIERAERAYDAVGQKGLNVFFAVLKAQAYRNLGDYKSSLEWLSKMGQI